jgi:Tn3 transposase DDE domain
MPSTSGIYAGRKPERSIQQPGRDRVLLCSAAPGRPFGGEGVIRQNNREEPRKIIRYNHLVANLVVFHNVVSMTRVLQDLIDAGYPITPEIIARLSPYKTEHMNRFGHYELRVDRVPPPISEELRLSPAPGKVETMY